MVVRQTDGGAIQLSALDPEVMVRVTGRPELGPMAQEAGTRLRAALATVAAGR
ncbi:hypothetical protein JD78_01201 [Modestobacter roseus]|uniref:Uncharacterized protein n=1 Tax=Modestobacter roseus TaxID=1181884 RepID=A0A562INT9_9ACTN|nr:hypothetical protein JD78_01201 [Modestobacter roseus]